MKFTPPLMTATLIKRYKRFLTDVTLPDGSFLTMHCPNTGSMTGCAEPGSRIWYSKSENPKRKYPHTFELIEVAEAAIAGVNTGRANALVREAIENGLVEELQGYQSLKAEVRYGNENSRIDFLLQEHSVRFNELCYVEVKSVTLSVGEGLGLFPDAVTTRGAKHLRELIQMKADGHRAVLFFCVQHTGIDRVEPADAIDPEYGKTLRLAADAGVEIIAYKAKVSATEIILAEAVPVNLPRL